MDKKDKTNIIGKIYSIRSFQTKDVYIGSTTEKYLSTRLSKHKSDYRRYIDGKRRNITSFMILQYDDAYIELIEEVSVKNKDELHKIEGKYIRKTKHCINRCIAGRKNKEYQNDNKEKIQQKTLCVCGSLYCKSHKKRHEKAKKHTDFIDKSNNHLLV